MKTRAKPTCVPYGMNERIKDLLAERQDEKRQEWAGEDEEMGTKLRSGGGGHSRGKAPLGQGGLAQRS